MVQMAVGADEVYVPLAVKSGNQPGFSVFRR